MTDTATLEARLAEAEAALHALLTGEQVAATTDVSGRQVTYARADLGQLRAYIAGLKAELGLSTGRRALAVRFG
ncbi:gpW family head-tail joining protein [Oceanibacterium hippocampi]|uniref:GpW n=1 Tax=Oceanibacterium hippocampi TaxID=745714 RepID=A0A1Y5U3I1_9PROT|nr:gpW family head-tail joining protein [Oceanibacterium hippocampi]SLN77580.1 gpW [Oceanibacterium hippocampi]